VRPVRIGSGAGYAGDRFEPAAELIATVALDAIVFECLAERTIALGQLERMRDPDAGYNPFLAERMRLCLPLALARGVKIVTNMGAANPRAAARRIRAIAADLGLPPPRIAIVTGDDVVALVRADDTLTDMGTGAPIAALGNRIVAANAYLGGDVVRDALETGADVVIAGRVADPSLFTGVLMHLHGFGPDDIDRLGPATVVGHLLECAGQVTGGYFADPGVKDVDGLERLGFPYAEVAPDGSAVIAKAPGTGGRIDRLTCTEQLLYEVHDPAAYVTPDCVADFSGVRLTELGGDRVRVEGARARSAPDSLKVSVCYRAGFMGEGHVAYAGPNARGRAELAGEIVRARLAMRGLPIEALRVDLIGVNALHGPAAAPSAPSEVRLRVAARCPDRRAAELVAQEVQSLLTNGPAGGAGDFMQVREILGVASTLVARARIRPAVEILS